VAERHFRLSPWPFAEPEVRFEVPARHLAGKLFGTSAELEAAFGAAPVERLTVTLSQ
jgi:hypothetical protein